MTDAIITVLSGKGWQTVGWIAYQLATVKQIGIFPAGWLKMLAEAGEVETNELGEYKVRGIGE